MAKKDEFSPEEEEKIAEMVYDIEQAFLDIFRKEPDELVKPDEGLNALAIASAHIIQAFEALSPVNGADGLSPFIKVLKEYHKIFTSNPTGFVSPIHTSA